MFYVSGEVVKTTVVNLRKESYDVYIGRNGEPFNFGNPFTHLKSATFAHIKVESREDSIRCFEHWLLGMEYPELEPVRRAWIISQIKKLKGKRLGCFCKPKACHGDILARLADGN
jgi:hypothetical protein